MSYIAVDIGATNVRVATGGIDGLHEKVSELTETGKGAGGVSQQIIRLIEGVMEGTPETIGIGSIGPIDMGKGEITNTPNYPFNHIPISQPLKEHFSVKASLVNDCAAAVLGEQRFGAGKGYSNLVYVTISTGLGGGAIVDNHLLKGKDGNAPEIGHITIDPYSDIKCGCGSYGHWEAYASGSNIPKYAKKLMKLSWRRSLIADLTGGDLDLLTSKTIYDAAKQGDEVALGVVAEIGRINAVGFANITNVFDPELITVGGSIALNNPRLVLDPIRENIDKHLINRKPEIMVTPLGEDAVLIGALALAMRV